MRIHRALCVLSLIFAGCGGPTDDPSPSGGGGADSGAVADSGPVAADSMSLSDGQGGMDGGSSVDGGPLTDSAGRGGLDVGGLVDSSLMDAGGGDSAADGAESADSDFTDGGADGGADSAGLTDTSGDADMAPGDGTMVVDADTAQATKDGQGGDAEPVKDVSDLDASQAEDAPSDGGGTLDGGAEIDGVSSPPDLTTIPPPVVEPTPGGFYGCTEDVEVPSGKDVPGPCYEFTYQGDPPWIGIGVHIYGYDCLRRKVYSEVRWFPSGVLTPMTGYTRDTLDEAGAVVKSIDEDVLGNYTEKSYTYDDQGRVLLVETTTGKPATKYSKSEVVYELSPAGAVLREDHYGVSWTPGEVPGTPYWSHSEYTYDDVGRILTHDTYYSGVWWSRDTFDYQQTPFGDLVRKSQDLGSATWAFAENCYFPQGMCYTLHPGPDDLLHADGFAERGEEFLYDSKGNLTMFRTFFDWGWGISPFAPESSGYTCPYGLLCHRLGWGIGLIVYDDNGSPTSGEVFDGDGKYHANAPSSFEVFTYDEFGREIWNGWWSPFGGWENVSRKVYDCWDLGTATAPPWEAFQP